MAVVGVIPAAGQATRLQPLPVSKEVYPISGRPVMDFLVERMLAAPCSELRVVTRPEKRDVIDNARGHGATVIEAEPPTLASSLLAGMWDLADDDVVLFGFPDSIWYPVDGYRRILPLLGGATRVVLGLFEAEDLTRYEPVMLDEAGRVLGIEFKPEHPSSRWIWGCAAATAATLRPLAEEQEPGIFFDSLARQGAVAGAPMEGTYLDIGTPRGLQEALELKLS